MHLGSYDRLHAYAQGKLNYVNAALVPLHTTARMRLSSYGKYFPVTRSNDRNKASLILVALPQIQHDPTRLDPIRPDPTRPDPTRPDPTRPDPTRPDPTRPDPTRPDPIRPNPTRPDPIRPDPTRSDAWAHCI
ncbi:hypothetical protein ANN_15523 [Periplaneta americana]|uniref:Uncharacterized protein n=1 Tax=Periplaneta americana TaxID=6978 RepID=A0ABQ8SHA9_PERAM|nr:hypothetical protein ANN_15523 [Periplaneta americana]